MLEVMLEEQHSVQSVCVGLWRAVSSHLSAPCRAPPALLSLLFALEQICCFSRKGCNWALLTAQGVLATLLPC